MYRKWDEAPLYWLDLISKIHFPLESKSYKYTDTCSNMPTTPSDAWNDFVNIWFLMHRGDFGDRRPECPPPSTLESSHQTPNPTPKCTDASPIRLKPTASRTLWLIKKKSPPSALSNPLWTCHPPPTTPTSVNVPTWSNWAYNFASDQMNKLIGLFSGDQCN